MAVSKPTKGFFEQDQRNKVGRSTSLVHAATNKMRQPRPAQWHRPHNKAPLSETSGNVQTAKPPIPATSQAKSKLKAFEFVKGPSDENLPDADTNDDSADSNHDGGDEESAFAEVHGNKPTSPAKSGAAALLSTPHLPHANTFPCTPGTRLPLEDLIGSFEETTKKAQPTDQTPEEHIGWIPNSSSALLTPNRKRKRARSSSPSCPTTSSQRNETLAFFPGTAAEAEKQTPEADPAADLWKRYATEKQADGTAHSPDFGHLVFQLSPRATETPASKNAGLRRWASAGNDWPSSKCKRRRTTAKSNVTLWQDEQVAESGSKSKVAAMVDKLQESLATQRLANPPPKPAIRVEGPSSSSPLPETGAADSFNSVPSASPLDAKQAAGPTRSDNHHHQQQQSKPNAHTTKGPQIRQPADKAQHMSESHHTTMPPLDSIISAPLHLQSKAPLPAYKRPSITRVPSTNMQQHSATLVPPPAKATLSTDLDEFADDLDLSAEDLEELMTQPPPLHQRPLHQIPAHPNPPAQQQLNPDQHQHSAPFHEVAGHAGQPIYVNDFDDDDDEFGGNDIDEASLAQAEFSATQAFRASLSNSNVSHVRSR